MDKPSLEGIDLRIRRAEDHLAVLNNAVTRFLREKRENIVGEYDPKRGDFVFRTAADRPPLDWGISVGEIAHQLRSALDNLVWDLVILRGNTPGRANQFPIVESHAEWGKVINRNGNALQGTDPSDVKLIEAAQPYQRGPEWSRYHPLSLLQFLNNADKHRILHAGFVAMGVHLPDNQTWIPIGNADEEIKRLFPGGQSPPMRFLVPIPAAGKDVSE